jgi:hypothetical protein
LKLQRKAIQENLEDQSQFDHIGMKVKWMKWILFSLLFFVLDL